MGRPVATTVHKAVWTTSEGDSSAKIMKASIFFLVLASASAAPQFEGLKNIFSALSGDDEAGEVNGDYEQVPYTTLKKFDGYEMRQYPSVKWVCTDATYKMEKEDSVSRDTNDFNLIKMVQEMMSGKGWKNKPENKMFMKLFRYISGVNKEQEEVEMTVTGQFSKTFAPDLVAYLLRAVQRPWG